MREYAVSELVKEVKVILDRNQETAALVPTDSDTLSQGEIIRGVIVDAARTIEENAPITKLDTIDFTSQQVSWTSDNGAYIGQLTLPNDLLRLVRVKASDWSRPAIVISEDDDAYLYQSNKYVRGNSQKPIAVLAVISGVRVLELYTSKSSSATADISYISAPSIDDDKIKLCTLLKDAILYMAAYLTCITLGDIETAARYKATAYQLANIVEPSQTE